MTEPDFGIQKLFPPETPHESIVAWAEAQVENAKLANCTWFRVCRWEENPNLLKLDAWKVRPEQEAKVRFEFDE